MSEVYEEGTRKPSWLKIRLHEGPGYAEVSKVLGENSLHTICASGKCPNQAECWSRRTATFMIGGDICTRSCKFCATKTGKPLPLDPAEPEKVARSVNIMGLRYCVLTSVDRDDIPDGGAHHWAATVRKIRELNPATKIELLIPDFNGDHSLLDVIVASGADVTGHNMETVERITPQVRSRAKYRTSLEVLKYLSQKGVVTKSGLMVGLGETEAEMLSAMDEMARAGCRILTIGQYLQPTRAHLPVAEYVRPEKFLFYKEEALKRGFLHVESSPLTRSSYMADKAAAAADITPEV